MRSSARLPIENPVPSRAPISRNRAEITARDQGAPEPVPPMIHNVSRSGSPPDTTTRGYAKARFGHDFARVAVRASMANGAAAGYIGPRSTRVGANPDLSGGSVYVRRERRISEPGSPHPLEVLRRRIGEDRGVPLPEPLRADWGHRLGRDLSPIRVHGDAESSRAAASSGANALSYGTHLFFAPGRFDTRSADGLRLLGHEVTHALQTSKTASVPAGQPPVGRREGGIEAEAESVGSRLSRPGAGPVRMERGGQPLALRGDKKIRFSGTNITVSDTYVLYGPGVSPAFVARFRKALDTYYNARTFTYRGYTVNFGLSVREAVYRMVTRGKGFPIKEMVDSNFDSDTKLFNVEKGSGRPGGILDITLYDSSGEAAIAHEVGHYLSDKTGYSSERYSEGIFSRLGITETVTTPDPGCEGDIMATLSGMVTDCALSDFLDETIDEHEARVRAAARDSLLFGGP